jgi:hypothetical protein
MIRHLIYPSGNPGYRSIRMRDYDDITSISSAITPSDRINLSICANNRSFSSRLKRIRSTFSVRPSYFVTIGLIATLVSAGPIVDIKTAGDGLPS